MVIRLNQSNSMKNLFLTSQFSQVVHKFIDHFSPEMAGNAVGFISTASQIYDDPWWMRQDRDMLVQAGFSVTDIDITKLSVSVARAQVSAVDIIFVAGGNTFYLLQELRKSGTDQVLIDAINKGQLYVGSSAGSIVVGPTLEPITELDEPEGAPDLKEYNALAVVDFVVMPHIGNPKFEPVYRQGVVEKFQSLFPLVPITDDQAVVVKGAEHFIV